MFVNDFIQFLALRRFSIIFIICNDNIKVIFLWFLLDWLKETTAAKKPGGFSITVFEYVCENV